MLGDLTGSLLVAGLSATLGLSLPAGAVAEPPVDLSGHYIVDTVGALDGRTDEVQDALDRLFEETGVGLYVVYVGEFTSPRDPVAWADDVAELNGLGVNDVVLAVAVDSRNYALSIDSGFRLSDRRLDAVEADHIEPALRANDWAGAAIGAAEGMRLEINRPFPWGVVGVIAGIIVIVGATVLILRARKRSRAESARRAEQEKLEQQASTLLVDLDDQVKTSEQELGFVIAQFGDDAVEPFRVAVEGAKEKLRSAFALRQKLDDAEPETPAEQRAIILQVIELAEAADAELDAQADAFDELRALEQRAPEAVAEVRAHAKSVGDRLAAARTTLGTLSQRFSSAALASVAGNPAQIEALLQLAEQAVSDADAELAEGDRGGAAVDVRTAQAALTQTEELLVAVDELAADLEKAAADLTTVAADVRSDIAEARASAASDERLTAAISAAENALAMPADDPITALASLEAADDSLEKILAAVREAQLRRERASAALGPAFENARASISEANRYISTRRGGIGPTPRTRLSEAHRRLDAAVTMATGDPVNALAEARAASSLARQALQYAQSEVSYHSSGGYSGGGGDAFLGGLLGSLLGGGGGSSRSSSSWGSSSRSSSSSRRSSSFGGSSRSSSSRSRSSSGGRSSGGRSRGGRF